MVRDVVVNVLLGMGFRVYWGQGRLYVYWGCGLGVWVDEDSIDIRRYDIDGNILTRGSFVGRLSFGDPDLFVKIGELINDW